MKWKGFAMFSAIMFGFWVGVTMFTFDTTVMLWDSIVAFVAGLWTLFILRVMYKLEFSWEAKKRKIRCMMAMQ